MIADHGLWIEHHVATTRFISKCPHARRIHHAMIEIMTVAHFLNVRYSWITNRSNQSTWLGCPFDQGFTWPLSGCTGMDSRYSNQLNIVITVTQHACLVVVTFAHADQSLFQRALNIFARLLRMQMPIDRTAFDLYHMVCITERRAFVILQHEGCWQWFTIIRLYNLLRFVSIIGHILIDPFTPARSAALRLILTDDRWHRNHFWSARCTATNLFTLTAMARMAFIAAHHVAFVVIDAVLL